MRLNKSKVAKLALTAGAWLLATAAHAAAPTAPTPSTGCQLTMEPMQTRWAITSYDPFAGSRPIATFDVAYTNSGTSACQGDVNVRLQGDNYGLAAHGAGNTQRLSYALSDNMGGADITPRTGRSDRRLSGRSLVVSPGERLIRSYTLQVDPGRLPGDGSYEQVVFFSVETSDHLPLAERTLTLAIDVTPSAVLGLRGAFTRDQGGAHIDLGDLSPGPRNLPLQLSVLSTRSYRVQVRSNNQGELRYGSWAVPYSIVLGDRAMSLKDVAQLDVRTPGVHDDSYGMGVVIGETAGRRAGLYSDILTLTVSPL